MIKRLFFVLLACVMCLFLSCSKDKSPFTDSPVGTPPETPVSPGQGGTNNHIYADSLFFVQEAANIIKPLSAEAGTYSSTPEGLKIEDATGEINVNKSETGLMYKVTFTPAKAGGNTLTSYVIISGINYQDKIYNLSAGDSIATPIYNANTKLMLPGTGKNNIFDEDGSCKKVGISINGDDARINLAKSVRNQGIDTGATTEVKLAYRLNDGSNRALNGLNVKIYFYRTAKEIPQYLTDLLEERKTTIFNQNLIQSSGTSGSLVLAGLSVRRLATRARPPCIIVVSR
jgi:hypothetical protein